MILTVGGIKGGTGKTTISSNLAVMRSASGKKVLLVDADEQKTSSVWANQRLATGLETKWVNIKLFGKAVHSEILKMKHDYDDIIIDVGGRETRSLRAAIAIADILLVPFRPRSADIWGVDDIRNVISEMIPANPNLKCFSIINQAESKGNENDEAITILKEFQEFKCLNITIGARKSFDKAFTDGIGVVELPVKDKKAIEEIQNLYDFLYNECTDCVH